MKCPYRVFSLVFFIPMIWAMQSNKLDYIYGSPNEVSLNDSVYVCTSNGKIEQAKVVSIETHNDVPVLYEVQFVYELNEIAVSLNQLYKRYYKPINIHINESVSIRFGNQFVDGKIKEIKERVFSDNKVVKQYNIQWKNKIGQDVCSLIKKENIYKVCI